MAKGSNQKLKMLYLVKIFMEETDEQNPLTMQQLISKLNAYGVNADRKTIYMDLEELKAFGIDIITEQEGRKWYYHVGARDFELPELKLLVDSVQSAKFMTDKKSNELIRKIKEMELRRDGAWYQNSPWGLMWDDENYYLVAFSSEDGKIRHYRVDKMLDISIVNERREGKQEFKAFDLPHYTKSLFGMFGGEEKKVTIEAANDMVGVMIDRFGKDIIIAPIGEERFRITVNVAVSRQFLGWIIALGEGVKITGPEEVVER